jgi:hypothetical protein
LHERHRMVCNSWWSKMAAEERATNEAARGEKGTVVKGDSFWLTPGVTVDSSPILRALRRSRPPHS